MLGILGYDITKKTVYGVAENRRAYMKFQMGKRTIYGTAASEWYRVRDSDSTILATEVPFIPDAGYLSELPPPVCLTVMDAKGNSWGGKKYTTLSHHLIVRNF